MTDSNGALRNAVRNGQMNVDGGPVPDFDDVWASASARAAAVRRRNRVIAGTAGIAAALAIAFGLRAPSEDEWQYIDAAEFLETTRWSAPSDSLLPDHEVDIYEDIPVLFESTETFGGALL